MGHSTSLVAVLLVTSFFNNILSLAQTSPDPATASHSGKGKRTTTTSTTRLAPAPPSHVWQWPILAAVRAASSEALAEAAFTDDSLSGAEVTSPGDGDLSVEVGRLVRRGWWSAARAGVVRSHKERLDLTASVRRAVSDMKQEADELLRWLEPSYARPAPTPMALRWAQNFSAIMLAARFSSSWEAPGANLAVFSTEKGQGHVDKDRTAANVRSLLQVNLTQTGVFAEITAKTGNSRKRFTLALDLFDVTVPAGSSWEISFRKAQGSMQMSRGAEIPELHIVLRKRWPSLRQWPRLTVRAPAKALTLWGDAPVTLHELQRLEDVEAQKVSHLTCHSEDRFYCPSEDGCVTSCSQCQHLHQLHKEGLRCTAPRLDGLRKLVEEQPSTDASNITFIDEDLAHTKIGGSFCWQFHDQLLLPGAFALCWVSSKTTAKASEMDVLSTGLQLADREPCLRIPAGTPERADQVMFVALEEQLDQESVGTLCSELQAGQAIDSAVVIAKLKLQDAWRPSPPNHILLRFEDTDPRAMRLQGAVEFSPEPQLPGVAPTISYELHWGGRSKDGKPQLITDDSEPLAHTVAVAGNVRFALTNATGIAEDGGVRMPPEATHFSVFAVGGGGVRSVHPVGFLQFPDARPPTLVAKELQVSGFEDRREDKGSVSFIAEVYPGECAADVQMQFYRCDAGSSFVLYWADELHNRTVETGGPIGELDWHTGADLPLRLDLANLVVPEAARALTVIARNTQGEMRRGVTVGFNSFEAIRD